MFQYTRKTLILEVVMILVTLIMLLPFWILLVTSFKTLPEVLGSAALAPPKAPTFDNFATLLSPDSPQSAGIIQALLTSILITVGSIVGLIALGAPAAFVLARSTRKWSTRTFYLFAIAIILPTQLGTLPLYVGAKNVGLVGNPWGMMLIFTGMLLPLAVFIYAGFFRRLPRDYEESATLDGASRHQVFSRVVFPLMWAATGTGAILAGLIVWNDFFTSLIFLSGSAWQTLPVAMYNYVGSLVSQWNLIFALVLVSMLPILLFYVFAQRRLIQGYAGGLKS